MEKCKQTITDPSIMLVEFVACYEATIQAVCSKNFISRLDSVASISVPIQIYCDNFLVLFHCKTNKRSSDSKYIENRYLV